MVVSILQSNYIPWKGYFDIIAKSDVFVIYDQAQYTKNDWRNRNTIKTPSGLQWLTIPVEHNSLSQRICDTKIAASNWARKHIAALQNNYAKAGYFRNYRETIFDTYGISTKWLSELNIAFIRMVCKLLKIKTLIIDSASLDLYGDKSERLLLACKKLNATTYLTGPAAKEYLDVKLFTQENIQVEWMNYSNYREYNQLFPPFVHNVTVLDLIFNMGEGARFYLNSGQ